MARITTGFPIKSISGRIGPFVFATTNGEVCAYRFKKRPNPRTDAQQARRGLFADAVRSWQLLSDEEKREWNELAWKKRKKLKRLCKGYHLYLRTVLFGETAPLVTGTAVFPRRNPFFLFKNRLRRSSVAAASALLDLLYPAPMPLAEPFFDPPEREKAA
ncbi:MAG TPA: hypothetical protein ENN21_03095 [Spirochaetes bacterium]|nr:hypothetical protein [Spirochaetota bacterium]